MTNKQAKSELMQIYMSLSEEKKQALDVLMAQADGEYISKSKMLMFLNDMRFGIAPDETVADDDERREREAQVDVLDDLMEVVEQMPTVAIPSAEYETEIMKYSDDEKNKALITLYFDSINCEDKEKRKRYNTAIKLIESIPSAEPKTGHWIEEDMFDGDVAYRCSECNELFWIEDGTPKDNGYDFCPKCGKRLIEPQEISDHNLKMWHDIYAEEKRREGSDKE